MLLLLLMDLIFQLFIYLLSYCVVIVNIYLYNFLKNQLVFTFVHFTNLIYSRKLVRHVQLSTLPLPTPRNGFNGGNCFKGVGVVRLCVGVCVAIGLGGGLTMNVRMLAMIVQLNSKTIFINHITVSANNRKLKTIKLLQE